MPKENNTTPKRETRFQITTRNGEIINLDKPTVIKYLTNDVDITDSEYTVFFQLCKTYGLNPFLKECYIVKYGSTPATIVVDYKILQQVAENNPNYLGMEHGVIVADESGKIVERNADYKLPKETLIAGWCKVIRKDRSVPTRVDANFEEFKGVTKNGEVNSNWKNKPCFMIVKVAKTQALREAFPNMFGSNVYIEEEVAMMEQPVAEPKGKTTITNSLADEEEVVETEVKETVLETE